VDNQEQVSTEKVEAVSRASALYRFWQIFKGMPSILLMLITSVSKSEFRKELEGRKPKQRPLREHILLGLEALGELWNGEVGTSKSRNGDWIAWLREKISKAQEHPEFWMYYYVNAFKAGLQPWSTQEDREESFAVLPEQERCYALEIGGCIPLYLSAWLVNGWLRLTVYQLACKLDEATTHFLLQHLSQCMFSVSKTTGGDHYFVGPIVSIGFEIVKLEGFTIAAPEEGKWWVKAPEGFLEVIQELVERRLPGATLKVGRSPEFRNVYQ